MVRNGVGWGVTFMRDIAHYTFHFHFLFKKYFRSLWEFFVGAGVDLTLGGFLFGVGR